jgi:bifunctional DNA-binding transcriptional regulator/antitoxin component of YhaV-PrlF toxin-antitoxin module
MKAERYISTVDENGQVVIPNLPLKKGSKVEVIIISTDADEDYLRAAESSIDFWHNAVDDEIWNDA